MGATTAKDRVLRAIEELPDHATFEDAMERLFFLYKVERGIRDADTGRTISHEEVGKRMAAKWQR